MLKTFGKINFCKDGTVTGEEGEKGLVAGKIWCSFYSFDAATVGK
jgi:hypothetical protein